MSRTNFLYHTEAVGATGYISLPVYDAMPVQASIASAIGASFGKSRAENVKHLDYLSIGSIESQVVSSFSEKDDAYGTLSSVVLEGLNTLHVVTCARMVLRLTSKHQIQRKKADAGTCECAERQIESVDPGSFIVHGTHFDDLRIAGHKIDLDLAVGLFSELSTWDKLNHAYATDASIRKEIDELALYPHISKDPTQLPVHNGVFGCTLARIPKKLPHGLKHAKEQGIYVPHFGTIYPAHFYIMPNQRRIQMLHVDLGCSVEGCNSYGNGGANGSTIPGSS